MKRLSAFILSLLCLGATANAHEVRPAYLQIEEPTPHHYTISWKQPVVGELAIRLIPHLSRGWLEPAPNRTYATPFYLIKIWTVDSQTPLDDQTLFIEGLNRSITDVLVRVNVRGRKPYQDVLRPDQPRQTLSFNTANGLSIPAYLRLGLVHILSGPDHLSFVLGLMLLIGLHWRLIKAITAFTAAHSLTLAAAALGYVHFPSAVIEALVAMSILFLASELVHARRGDVGLTVRYPWVIAFTFGLLHGLAFSGALADVGLPPNAIPEALLLFNVGVELGQLIFIAAAALAMIALAWLSRRLPLWWQEWRAEIPPYAIGSFAAFWFIERIATVFT